MYRDYILEFSPMQQIFKSNSLAQQQIGISTEVRIPKHNNKFNSLVASSNQSNIYICL
jgi:hypothetical protein